MHPSDGTLRRSLDEPFALEAAVQRHVTGCARCTGRLRVMERDASGVLAALATPTHASDVLAARARLAHAEGVEGAGAPRTSRAPAPARRRRTSRVLAGLAVAVTASVVLVVSGVSQDFLSIFQPQQVSAVPVTAADVRALAGLTSYGDVNAGAPLTIVAEPDAASASRVAGVAIPVVSGLPPGVPATAGFAVVSGGVVSFTFDASLARAAASRAGGVLPPMPSGLDGSTLTVSITPAVVVSYGLDLGASLHGTGLPSGEALVVIASRTPTVSSTGVTARQLEDYLLSLPGIPAGVAAEIRALGDPTRTIPVPVPIALASESTVSINGSSGLLIGDSTQLGSVVLWQHNGVVYAVAGTVRSDQALGIARSLR